LKIYKLKDKNNKKMRISQDFASIHDVYSPNSMPHCDNIMSILFQSKADLIPKPMNCEYDGIEPLCVTTLFEYCLEEIRLIIHWANSLPMFTDLSADDRKTLLYSSFMEITFLRLAFRSYTYRDDCVRIAENIFLNKKSGEQLKWGQDLIGGSIDFISQMKGISWDVNEFSAMCAIVLSFGDAKGLQDRATVINNQTRFSDSFRKYTISRYPHERRRYGRLILKLPILRLLAAKAYDSYVNESLKLNFELSRLNLIIEQSIT
jgi:hypothetical protein